MLNVLASPCLALPCFGWSVLVLLSRPLLRVQACASASVQVPVYSFVSVLHLDSYQPDPPNQIDPFTSAYATPRQRFFRTAVFLLVMQPLPQLQELSSCPPGRGRQMCRVRWKKRMVPPATSESEQLATNE